MTTIGKSILALLVTSGVMGRCQAQTPAATQGSAGAFVEVEGSKLYHEECGTGAEAVVLLHDGIAHSAVWDDVWPTFCKQFHAIRYDRRGYGRSHDRGDTEEQVKERRWRRYWQKLWGGEEK
jgi:pimeloyl-ACP methyl ester carboxylesterase